MMKRFIGAMLLSVGLAAQSFAQAPSPVPALPDSQRLTTYSISGTTCACSVGFQIYGTGTDVDEWIQVFVNGVAKLSTDPVSGWSLSSVTGPLGSIPRPITNAVLTFNTVQTATVVILGNERPRRLSQFPENRGVAARDLNQAITDAVAVQRELWDKSNRSITGQPGEVLPSLPGAASRPNTYLCFDSSGLPIVCQNVQTGVGVITLPGSSINGDSVCFNGTTGASFSDCNWKITGTPSAGKVPSGTGTAGAAIWAGSCLNFQAFGGVGDGATNNDSAWTASIAALSSSGGCIYFPVGKYRFNSPASYSFSGSVASLSIRGEGQDNTILYWPSGNGLSLTLATFSQSFHIRDVTFSSGAAPGGTALNITGAVNGVLAQNDVINTTFRGDDYGIADYWTTAVNVTVTNDIAFTGVNFIGLNSGGTGFPGTGNGVVLQGNAIGPVFAFNYYFTNTYFNQLNIGILINSYVQGVYVSQSALGGQTGISVNTALSGVLCCMGVDNTQFATKFGIAVATTFFDYTISNNLFFVPANGRGLNIGTNGGGSISGNLFTPSAAAATSGNIGAVIGTTGSPFQNTTIQGNTFYAMTIGLDFLAGSSGANAQANAFTANTTAVSNSGTGNVIANNIGYNPVGVSTGTYAPLTTVTYTAGASQETHYLTAGTVTAVKIPNNAGTTICAATPCTVNLGPNETMSVTYSVAPTDTVSVH